MSESTPSKVFLNDRNDPDMRRAREEARRTFRYFWRELAWERRRIVPGLDVACVKAAFSDGGVAAGAAEKGRPAVEEMWIGEVDFDGTTVRGELVNSPNWLTSVRQGDAVRLAVGRISDWMYVIGGEVYGAFTVQVLRARMGAAERAKHDEAWGLNFGDPAAARVVPEPKRAGGLTGLFRKPVSPLTGDHPMSVNMGPSLKEQVAKDPSFVTSRDDRGWTMLHHLALAGSSTGVRILLEAGADRGVRTKEGRTAAELAGALGWDEVVGMLGGR